MAWKKTLGSGYSGIVVAGGRVVTMFTDGTSDIVAEKLEDFGLDRTVELLREHRLGLFGAGLATNISPDGREAWARTFTGSTPVGALR